MGSISHADAIEMQARLSRATSKTEKVPVSRPVMKERELQEKISAYCRSRGWFVDVNQFGRPTTGAVGRTDFIIACDYGRTIFCECKVGNSKPTVAQNAVMAWLKKLGQITWLVYSFEDFLDRVKNAGL